MTDVANQSESPSREIAERIDALQPLDEHNRDLMRHVHPPDWTNPTPDGRYNLVVVGAGSGGLVSAAGAAGLGAKVALIERDLLGGDCLNVGCVPSKALIRCARAAAEARSADRYGVRIDGEVRVDFPAVMQRMRRLRAAIAPHDSAERLRGLGVDVFLGEAAFTGPDQIRVGDRTLRFSRAIVATGARPAVPPIPGVDQVDYLTNETIFSLTELPRRLIIIGAGPIGCEMAQAFARFGSKVHLIEAADQVLPREDPDAADRIERALKQDGVEVVCGGKASKFLTDGEQDGFTLEVDCAGERKRIDADRVLLSVGRAPNVELGLDAADVEHDPKAGITVNDRLQTTNRRIFAVGDCCLKYKFTHTADASARIAIQNALFFGRKKVSKLTVPWCTYTDPELAHVGMYPADAEEAGYDVRTWRVDLADNDRAIVEGSTDGFLKVYAKRGSDRILGATLVAPHAGEMISELTLAIEAGAGLGDLSNTIHCYPTEAEAFRQAGDQYNRSKLTPTVRRLFEKFLAFIR